MLLNMVSAVLDPKRTSFTVEEAHNFRQRAAYTVVCGGYPLEVVNEMVAFGVNQLEGSDHEDHAVDDHAQVQNPTVLATQEITEKDGQSEHFRSPGDIQPLHIDKRQQTATENETDGQQTEAPDVHQVGVDVEVQQDNEAVVVGEDVNQQLDGEQQVNEPPDPPPCKT